MDDAVLTFYTNFLTAVKRHNETEAAILLSTRPSTVNINDSFDNLSILTHSVSSPAVCRLVLLQPGIDINQTNKTGRTALHKACFYLVTSSIRLLLEVKADPNASDNLSITPLYEVLLTPERHKACELLIQHGGDLVDVF